MNKIHLIGIKGSGMSALACILHDNGYMVTGSDVEETFFTEECLRERNIPITLFSKENIEEDQIVIAGNAFPDTHEEVQEAMKTAKQYFRYHTFLGHWLEQFTSVAITGTHGKTSTTGIMSLVFKDAYPTSFLIGDGTGKGTKNTSHFIFEACEYRRHFYAYQPNYAVITNIDFDHPDYYHSLEDVKDSFNDFAKGVKKALIACGDDVHTHDLQADVPIYYYGLNDGNGIQAKQVKVRQGQTTFELWQNGVFLQMMTIPLVGTHHVQNVLAVLTIAMLESIPLDLVQHSLMQYTGVKRRFQKILDEEYIVIDDYAHHPTEIKATLQTAKLMYPEKEIVAIFQPHTFTRTKQFLDEFAGSLRGADSVYLCPIFGSARETNGELSIQDLQQKIPGSYVLREDTIPQLLEESDKVLLFMGAGDIQKYEKTFLALRSERICR